MSKGEARPASFRCAGSNALPFEGCLRGEPRGVWSAPSVRRFIAIVTPIVGLSLVTWWQTCMTTAAVVAAAGSPACSSIDAEPLGQITGVEVLGSTLTEGHGCGTGTDQIFKYVAIIRIPGGSAVESATFTPAISDAGATDAGAADSGASDAGVPEAGATDTGAPAAPSAIAGTVVAAQVAECFANATFQTLCAPDGGVEATYTVDVFAFNESQWNQTATLPDGGSPIAAKITGALPPPSTGGAAPACAPNSAFAIIQSALPSAGWVTTCTASQQSTIPVLATCAPLVAFSRPAAGSP